jgi:hypothetical protein
MLQLIIFDALLELFDISTKVGTRMCSFFLNFKAENFMFILRIRGRPWPSGKGR